MANESDFNDLPHIPGSAPNTSEHPYRLMAPGPVPVHPEVLKVLAEPPIHHRTPQFEHILRHTLDRLKKVFQTIEPVMILSSTGTGAMEAAITNTLSPGDHVLVLVSGKFGERWAHLAREFQLSLDIIDTAWGFPVNVSEVEMALEKKNYKAVLCTACETSTGALHPIAELARLTRDRADTMLIVDGITAVGATPLPMDDLGIDVLVAGSQKAFMLPTGLSMIALSEKAWKHNEDSKCPKLYWDLAKERSANRKNQTIWSSNVSSIRALGVGLEIMLKNGLSQHLKRINTLAKSTRAGLDAMGIVLFSQSHSPSLTAMSLPSEVDGKKVRGHLEEKYNVTIAGGQDQLAGKILRIGHMGYITDEDAIETVRLLGMALHDLYPLIYTAEMPDRAAAVVKEVLNEVTDS